MTCVAIGLLELTFVPLLLPQVLLSLLVCIRFRKLHNRGNYRWRRMTLVCIFYALNDSQQSGLVNNNCTCSDEDYVLLLEKWFPLQGERAHSLKLKLQSQSKLNPNHIQFIFCSSFFLWVNLSCVVATIFSSLAFLSSSISMANLSRLVATIFSSLTLLSSSVSTANLVTTFSSLSFLSNSLSSHRFILLRVARHCFS